MYKILTFVLYDVVFDCLSYSVYQNVNKNMFFWHTCLNFFVKTRRICLPIPKRYNLKAMKLVMRRTANIDISTQF